MIQVSVIVFSYNRPRMLREALSSIVGADEIIVLDDGSSFDVHQVVEEAASAPRVQTKVAAPLTVEKRLSTARFGKNTNVAVAEALGNVIAYLCDDDLFHPGWMDSIRKAWADKPDLHWAKGEWGVFEDGQAHIEIDKRPCPLPAHRMTTGSFCHMKACALGCGVKWSEETIAVHDNYLIHNALPQKHSFEGIPLIGPAGWRREHPYNMLKHVVVNDYAHSAKKLLKDGFLE